MAGCPRPPYARHALGTWQQHCEERCDLRRSAPYHMPAPSSMLTGYSWACGLEPQFLKIESGQSGPRVLNKEHTPVRCGLSLSTRWQNPSPRPDASNQRPVNQTYSTTSYKERAFWFLRRFFTLEVYATINSRASYTNLLSTPLALNSVYWSCHAHILSTAAFLLRQTDYKVADFFVYLSQDHTYHGLSYVICMVL